MGTLTDDLEVTATRKRRLNQIADEHTMEIYNEDTRKALNPELVGGCPRYAMVTTEGTSQSSYSSNGDLKVFATVEEMAEEAAAQIDDDWTPKAMWDLDAKWDPWGNLNWETRVVIK